MKIKPFLLQSLNIKGYTFSWIERNGRVIEACFCPAETLRKKFPGAEIGISPIMQILKLYSQGKRVELEKIPVKMDGTHFQKRVWMAMRKIPYGQVRTYGDLAKALHTSPRAIARAASSNKIPLFIPCHRVVGKNSLGGFTPDVKIKRTLLELERRTE